MPNRPNLRLQYSQFKNTRRKNNRRKNLDENEAQIMEILNC